MKRSLLIAVIVMVCVSGLFLGVEYRSAHTHGSVPIPQKFTVLPGENAFALGARLAAAGIVSDRFAFVWYLVRHHELHALVAGDYLLNGTLSIPDLAAILVAGAVIPRDIRVTFPEGWTSRQMADRLTANGLPGADFLTLVMHPGEEWRTQSDFLRALPSDATLEGYLFPDTYDFLPDASADTIVAAMLRDFARKAVPLLASGSTAHRDPSAVVTLASLVEAEVRSADDRRLVADIFWRRLAIGQPLQSDATIRYILGADKIQHSFEETRVASPYNTYVHQGLPPGPIDNPGAVALEAAAHPQSNPYFYFLSDPKTGETVYAVTFDEHIRNKAAHGLYR